MAKTRIGALSWSMVLDAEPMKQGLQRARSMMDRHRKRERARQRLAERGQTRGFGRTFQADRPSMRDRLSGFLEGQGFGGRRGGQRGRGGAGPGRPGGGPVGGMAGAAGQRLGASAIGRIIGLALRHPLAALVAALVAATVAVKKFAEVTKETAQKLANLTIEARNQRMDPIAAEARRRAAEDPLGRGIAHHRAAITGGDAGVASFGQALKDSQAMVAAQQDFNNEWERTKRTFSGPANRARAKGYDMMTKALSKLNALNEKFRGPEGQEAIAARIAALEPPKLGDTSQSQFFDQYGQATGPVATTRSTDRSLHDFFVRRQQQRDNEQMALAKEALKQFGETNEYLKNIADDIRSMEEGRFRLIQNVAISGV